MDQFKQTGHCSISGIHFEKLLHDGAAVSLRQAVDEVPHGVSKVSAEWKVRNLMGFRRINNLFVATMVTLSRVGRHLKDKFYWSYPYP